MQELTFPEVDGLIYINNFLTDVEHDELLANIDRNIGTKASQLNLSQRSIRICDSPRGDTVRANKNI